MHFVGIDRHGKRRGDALIAAARVAHHGDHRPGHPGVAGRRGVGENPREEAVAHHLPLPVAAQRAAHAVAVLPGQRPFGGGHVQTAGFEDEAQLFHGRGHGEIPHPGQGQGHLPRLLVAPRRGPLVEQHLAVAAHEDEIRMPAGNDRHGPMPGGFDLRLDVELFADALFQSDRDAPPADHLPAALHGLRRHVAQHLQPVFRTADQSPESHGDRQSDHPRSGNPDAHSVLEDVGAQAHGDPFGPGAQRLRGARRTQRHGDRLGAPDGGHHLAVDEIYDSASFG